jgi:hypothetical protein
MSKDIVEHNSSKILQSYIKSLSDKKHYYCLKDCFLSRCKGHKCSLHQMFSENITWTEKFEEFFSINEIPSNNDSKINSEISISNNDLDIVFNILIKIPYVNDNQTKMNLINKFLYLYSEYNYTFQRSYILFENYRKCLYLAIELGLLTYIQSAFYSTLFIKSYKIRKAIIKHKDILNLLQENNKNPKVINELISEYAASPLEKELNQETYFVDKTEVSARQMTNQLVYNKLSEESKEKVRFLYKRIGNKTKELMVDVPYLDYESHINTVYDDYFQILMNLN